MKSRFNCKTKQARDGQMALEKLREYSLKETHYRVSSDYTLVANAFYNFVPSSLFNHIHFFNLHKETASNPHYLQLVQNKTQSVVASAHFSEQTSGVFQSPIAGRGSFGSFQFLPKIDLTLREQFILQAEHYLAMQGAREIILVGPPSCYNLTEDALNLNVLLRNNYQIDNHELNYSIQVNASEFAGQIQDGNRQRLKRSKAHGFQSLLLQAHHLSEAYHIIALNRLKRGFPLTMKLSALKRMLDTFPDQIKVFGVTKDQMLVASAVCLQINPEILYVFYWGDRPGVECWSPVTLLAEKIYQFCQENKIKLLDLGTATVHGIPNHGLIKYKLNLGASVSAKLRFRKAL